MPKNTQHGGSSYDGHTDVSPSDRTQPEWVPGDDPLAVFKGELDDKVEEPKPKKNSTTAKAGAAKAKGATRA